MTDKTAEELARYFEYGRMVSRVLPVDEESERAVDEALRQHYAKQGTTKLVRKRQP